jgi:hypothetical protein
VADFYLIFRKVVLVTAAVQSGVPFIEKKKLVPGGQAETFYPINCYERKGYWVLTCSNEQKFNI